MVLHAIIVCFKCITKVVTAIRLIIQSHSGIVQISALHQEALRPHQPHLLRQVTNLRAEMVIEAMDYVQTTCAAVNGVGVVQALHTVTLRRLRVRAETEIVAMEYVQITCAVVDGVGVVQALHTAAPVAVG